MFIEAQPLSKDPKQCLKFTLLTFLGYEVSSVVHLTGSLSMKCP